MTNITITRQEAEKLLEDIQLENHITDKEVEYCKKRRWSTIGRMTDIFDHNSARDKILTQETFSLLGRSKGDSIVVSYSNAFGFPADINNLHANFTREDKILLLAAFRYNPVFYSLALSTCEDIKARLQEENPPDRKTEQNAGLRLLKTETPDPHPDRKTISPKPESAIAADGLSSQSIDWFQNETLTFGNIRGTLSIMRYDQHSTQFIFTFDEYNEKKPFDLVVSFTTTDNEYHEITLKYFTNNKEAGTAEIKSITEEGVYYSAGIKGVYSVEPKWVDSKES